MDGSPAYALSAWKNGACYPKWEVLRVMTERKTPAQAAAGWYLYLREDPDDEDIKRRFGEWLASDPAHVQAWSDMNVTASIMAAVPSVQQTTVISSHVSLRQKRTRFSAWKFVPACGVALAAVFAAMAFLPSDMLVRLRADGYAPVAQMRDIRLADGSRIILTPRAAVSIRMTSSERRVELIQGEALFEVQHDPSRPFRVTSGDVTVTDIGTVFDVRADNNATTVAVREGAVHVTSRGSTAATRDLYAGEWERITGAASNSGKQAPTSVGAWRDGTLIARDEPIDVLVEALRPWTKTRIILADRKLANKRVTGTYDLTQPEASLRLIVDAYGGKVASVMSWVDIVTAR